MVGGVVVPTFSSVPGHFLFSRISFDLLGLLSQLLVNLLDFVLFVLGLLFQFEIFDLLKVDFFLNELVVQRLKEDRLP